MNLCQMFTPQQFADRFVGKIKHDAVIRRTQDWEAFAAKLYDEMVSVELKTAMSSRDFTIIMLTCEVLDELVRTYGPQPRVTK